MIPLCLIEKAEKIKYKMMAKCAPWVIKQTQKMMQDPRFQEAMREEIKKGSK